MRASHGIFIGRVIVTVLQAVLVGGLLYALIVTVAFLGE